MAPNVDPGFGLKISPSVVLRNLLQQYPSGGQFFLEALQNADDTGRAGKFCALLDLRKHKAKSLRPPVASRAYLQNEAIIFHDDAGFAERDWRSLQFMCDSEKRQSPHEAGAFGMGSRSFFHITDVLQVLSGNKLSALDPDDILQTGHFGEQVDFVHDRLDENFPDEAAVFKGVFGCDMKSAFKGTIIRASLRTEERAKKCSFMPHAFDLSRAKRIFAEFEECLTNGEALLFLTGVAVVELWRWDDGASEPTLVARARLGVSSGHKLPGTISAPLDVKRFLQQFETFVQLEAALLKPGAKAPHVLDIVDVETQVMGSGAAQNLQWLRFGKFSDKEDILRLVGACRCVPMVTLALPLGKITTVGSLFASLPLPLTTNLPVHINSYFRLHDNRRAIWRLTPDLDGEHRMWAEWNDWILKTMVPLVYSQALELLASQPGVACDAGHSVWPLESVLEKDFLPILDPLVAELGALPLLATPTGKLARPVDSIYFPSPTPALQACRNRLLQLCASEGLTVVDPPEHIVSLLHGRQALDQKPGSWVLWEVILPAAPKLEEADLATLLLPFLDWAGLWKETEVRELGERLSDLAWVPTEAGTRRTMKDAFVPASSPGTFRVVKERRAKIGALIEAAGVSAETVWRILSLCGMKSELTWEDAADEAESVASDADVARGSALLLHLNQHQTSLSGSREASLSRIKDLAWLPVTNPRVSEQPTSPSQLLALKDIFPSAARKLVWAVAPALCEETSLPELTPGRTVEATPEVLLEQIRALALSARAKGAGPALASAQTLEYLHVAFGALLPFLGQLPRLDEHAHLADVAFVPCLPPDESSEGAALFAPKQAAFSATQDHKALSPVVGVVKSSDPTIRMIAEAAGVSQEPRAEVLAEALRAPGGQAPGADLAVTLAIELAARVRAAESPPPLEGLKVPSSKGTIDPVASVFVNDAPWNQQRDVVTLDGRISASDGHVLGCQSLRERMAQQCEAAELLTGEDLLAQEADVVGRIRQQLQECAEGVDFLTEFLRELPTPDAGKVAVFLLEDAFGVEKIVDPRAAKLQGAALYICMDTPLAAESLRKMQSAHVGVGSGGGLALGLDMMFRYSDCPQLLTRGCLHYFDVLQGFVTRPGAGRGRTFTTKLLEERFPESHQPFAARQLASTYGTVFRLPLRAAHSDLGLRMELEGVRAELRQAAALADKVLLFSRHLQRMEFHDGDVQIAVHEKTVRDAKPYARFLAAFPATRQQLTPGKPVTYLGHQSVSSVREGAAATAEWVVAHHVAAPDGATNGVKEEEGAEVVLLPHGAAAIRVDPPEEEPRGGRVCCGSPTPIYTNSCAWVHGCFAHAAAREFVPLPHDDAKSDPSRAKRWNHALLAGPIAESVRSLIAHCIGMVLGRQLNARRYFALFPLRGDPLQTALAAASFSLEWFHSEIILPSAGKLAPEDLAGLLFALLEWAGAWPEAEIRALGETLKDLRWVPTEGGEPQTIRGCFDPAHSPEALKIVQERRVKIDPKVAGWKLDTETVWRVLKLCGMKQEISWVDAVEEAEAVIRDGSCQRGRLLYEHLGTHHALLEGNRFAALERLRKLAWVPATTPRIDAEPKQASQLLALQDVFTKPSGKVVWAVAPSLTVDVVIEELSPGRSVEAEPEILLQQVKALADSAEKADGVPPHISAATLGHVCAAFGALLPLLAKLPSLEDHPLLKDLAFVPCMALQEGEEGADLYTTRTAAFHAQHNHSALHPVVGIVKSDRTLRMVAEAANVGKEPRSEVLAEALCRSGEGAPGADLAVALAVELAGRIRAKDAQPPDRIMVPNSRGVVMVSSEVYIDDAPWSNQREIVTLHPRISGDDARLLGCTSLREEIARQCEDPVAAAGEGDPFGQEVDLVSSVRQLLQEYGESADLVSEFVQNSDDAGAQSVLFFLRKDTFPRDRIVDPRASALQGAALYICSDKPLCAEDIRRMQTVGQSKKRLEFGSSGRFGVGLNVMYRYCDCPQLLANNNLHFFDLTRSYVAKTGMKRGRQFTVNRMKENFPDSYAPFGLPELAAFPTVFRLALRTERTDLGFLMDLDSVRSELLTASAIAEKMMLFAKNIRRLEFHDETELMASHEAVLSDPEKHDEFYRGLPKTIPELQLGPMKAFLDTKTITMETPRGTTSCQWAIAHRVGVTDEAMLQCMQQQFEKPHGVALLPYGAAAVKLKAGEDEELRKGRVCSGLPTPFHTNSAVWLQGSFALLSSRKALPVPEEFEDNPSLDKKWNRMLLEGPIASSMEGLIVHCTGLVLFQGFEMERFFALFPLPGDRLQSILAHATWKHAISQSIFPVVKQGKITTWVSGPTPTFRSSKLPEDVTEALIADGLKLVHLPDDLVAGYEQALGEPRNCLGGGQLCDFLRDTFKRRHPKLADRVKKHGPEEPGLKNVDSRPDPERTEGAEAGLEDSIEMDLSETKMGCLANKDWVMSLLRFAVNGIWVQYASQASGQEIYKFCPEELAGVPLLMTHAQQVLPFCTNEKFSSWRDVLPEKKSLFMHRETNAAVVEAVDTTLAGVERSVTTTVPGVKPFTIQDLMPYRAEVERSIKPHLNFMQHENETLRVFWSLVAESFAETLQIAGYDVFAAAQTRAWLDRERKMHPSGIGSDGLPIEDDTPKPTGALGDNAWCGSIVDWKVLPICSKQGSGENGEDIVELMMARMCVAVTLVDSDPKVVQSLTAILQEAGIDTIQHDVMSDNRISRLLRTLCVTTNDDMLSLLIEHGNLDDLTGVQRHDLMAYFSVLCVKGEQEVEVDLARVGRLKVFKTAALQSSFISLEKETQYCCVDPSDPHANALSKLMPPGVVMLAWPTQQIKPLYEHLGVQLCSGEEAMVTLIIPRLPSITLDDDDGTNSEPFMMELYAYVCIDASDRVISVASMSEFVASEDASRVGTPAQFTSPAGRCAAAFKDFLGPYLPVWWMQQNQQYMDMLHALGMRPRLSASMVLLCAGELDVQAKAQAASAESVPASSTALAVKDNTESLRVKSFELVEEFARCADEVWPQPGKPTAGPAGNTTRLALPPSQVQGNVKDMKSLLEVASMRILMVRRHKGESSKKDSAAKRNTRSKLQAQKSDAGLESASTELSSFRGVAFRGARQVLWTVCPLADHRSSRGLKDSHHLKILLERHGNGMNQVFGSFVHAGHAPPALVMSHLACLCSLMQSEAYMASITTGSQLHEDLKACWSNLSEHLAPSLSDAAATPEGLEGLAKLRALPCVSVTNEDAADRAADVTMLALPKNAFFALPLLKGKEATLKLYLRQVHAETTKEAAVFRALGASEMPRIADYAGASERVAAKAAELGRVNWEWVAACLEACVRFLHEDFISIVSSKGKEDQKPPQVDNLHMFTMDGNIANAKSLVWPDELRWLKRCEKAEGLKFCALTTQEQRETALSLVQVAGLRQLTAVVEERRVVEYSKEDDENKAFKENVENVVRSFEFARGLHAVMQNSSENQERTMRHTLAEVTMELRKIKFRSTKSKLCSGLFWRSKLGEGSTAANEVVIPGSEQDQQVYFDEADRVIFIGSDPKGRKDDNFTAELVFSLKHAVSLLWEVEYFLLEALLRSALRHGPEGVLAFLEKRDIRVDTLAPRHLGAGDLLPDDLQENLLWSMNATFGEGECAAVMHGDVFIIAEVAKWSDQGSVGEGLQRSYLMKISGETYEPRKHFEVYKIHSRSSKEQASSSTALALIEDSGVENKDENPADAPASEADKAEPTGLQKHLAEVKTYLKEMGSMSADDYKAVMRRLFKTWHPDKVGDTPLANKIFHLLRMHEQWFKKRLAGDISVGDDSWLDKVDEEGGGTPGPTATTKTTNDGPLALPMRTYTPAEGGQASWFDEFEVEMKREKEEKEAGRLKRANPRMPDASERSADTAGGAGPSMPEGRWQGPTRQAAADGPLRMVDKQLSQRFMQEAKVELVCVRRLIRQIDGMRTVPPRAVFHCQQAIEMGLNSAMLRTCGVSEDEVGGGAAHDLIDHIKRIKMAEANTMEQRRSQQVPLEYEDVDWLKRAYLASRYPKPGRWGVPALLYDDKDAARALKLAELFVGWAERVEDLPDPSKLRRRWGHEEAKTLAEEVAGPLPMASPPSDRDIEPLVKAESYPEEEAPNPLKREAEWAPNGGAAVSKARMEVPPPGLAGRRPGEEAEGQAAKRPRIDPPLGGAAPSAKAEAKAAAAPPQKAAAAVAVKKEAEEAGAPKARWSRRHRKD